MKRTVTRAETRFYCHTATLCHTKQFDHCKDIWAGTQHSPGLCFEHNGQVRTPIKPWKKYFFCTVNYIVGIIITRYGIKSNPHKVQVLTTATKPTSREDFLLFLNMTPLKYHSTFIPGLNTKTKQMKKVTNKHECLYWSQEYQKEFDRLKNSIIKDTNKILWSILKIFVFNIMEIWLSRHFHQAWRAEWSVMGDSVTPQPEIWKAL